jgi:hypothetical protein
MSSEPEKPIEKLLRASAKERHDQAGNGWEMPPATRRVLQGEVARRFGRRSQAKPGWFGWLLGPGWVRPIGAMAAMAVVAVAAVWILTSKKPESLLAKNQDLRSPAAASSAPVAVASDKPVLRRTDSDDESKRSKELLADNAGTARPEESLTSSLKQTELAKDKESALDRAVVKAEPSGVTQSEPRERQGTPAAAAGGESDATRSVAAQAPAMTQRYGLARGLQPSAVAPPATSSAEPVTAGSANQVADALTTAYPASLPNETQSTNQEAWPALNTTSTNAVQYGYFAAAQIQNKKGNSFQELRETETAADRKTATLGKPDSGNQILVSFRVEQSGPELRVIDQDGSVYAGPIHQAPASAVFPATSAAASAGPTRYGDAKPQAPAAGTRDFKTPQQANIASVFQVVGTNRSSNQKVIFSGSLTTDTSALGTVAAKSEPVVGGVTGAVQLQANQTNMPLQNLRVSGRAVVGAGQVIEIEAVPVPGQH